MRALNWLTGWIVQNHIKFCGTFKGEELNLNEIYGKQDDFTVTIISSVFNKACDDAGLIQNLSRIGSAGTRLLMPPTTDLQNCKIGCNYAKMCNFEQKQGRRAFESVTM